MLKSATLFLSHVCEGIKLSFAKVQSHVCEGINSTFFCKSIPEAAQLMRTGNTTVPSSLGPADLSIWSMESLNVFMTTAFGISCIFALVYLALRANQLEMRAHRAHKNRLRLSVSCPDIYKSRSSQCLVSLCSIPENDPLKGSQLKQSASYGGFEMISLQEAQQNADPISF